MNLFAEIRSAVVDALDRMTAGGVLPGGLDLSAVAVEPPRDAAPVSYTHLTLPTSDLV